MSNIFPTDEDSRDGVFVSQEGDVTLSYLPFFNKVLIEKEGFVPSSYEFINGDWVKDS